VNSAKPSVAQSSEETIERGLEAQRINPLLEYIVAERRNHIVQQLVASYKSRDLNTERLWAAVGALAELSDIVEAGTRKIAAMHRALERR
jgi:hypothetical protein